MKFSRSLAILVAALSLPAVSFAAKGTGSITAGSASSAKFDKAATQLEVGSKIAEGDVIETSSSSGTEVTLSNGAKLVLGPGTRIRLRTLNQSSNPGFYSFEILLLRGTLSGDASGASSSSNFAIRTTAGTANVAGSSFAVTFTPSSVSGGNLSVTAFTGSVSLLPTGSTAPVVVGAGTQTVVGQGAPSTPVISPINAGAKPPVVSTDLPSSGEASNPSNSNSPSDQTNIPGQQSVPKLPDFSVIVISPNGEGSGV